MKARGIFLSLLIILIFALILISGCSSSSDPIPQPASTQKSITAFSLNGVAGTINETAKTIAIAMPYGTSVTNLVATFITTGASVKVGSTVQTTGTTANDFTSPLIYTVTAMDSTTSNYTVTVMVSFSIASTYTAIYDSWNGYPESLAVDTIGNIYVAQYGELGSYNLKFDNSLNLISKTSTPYNGYWGITILSNGDIVVSDCPWHGYNPPQGNHRIVRLNPTNYSVLNSFGSSAGSGTTKLYNPARVASDRYDNIYVADDSNNRLIKLSSTLNYVSEYNLNDIWAVDVRDDYVYVANYDGSILKKLNLDLSDTGLSGQIGSSSVQDLAIDSLGRVYAVTDNSIKILNKSLQVIATYDNDLWYKSNMSIAIDQNDFIFISNRYKGVAKLNPY